VFSLKEIDKEYERNHGPISRYPMNKVDYEILIETEKTILKMDRLFRKVDKFNNRRYIDRENHERREKRMANRATERWENNYTVYYGGLTEEEQKYRDYYQTEIERDPEDEEVESKLDEIEVFSRGDYDLNKYDFQEEYTRNPEEDATSFIEKKAFKFKYRIAKDDVATYTRRQSRMIAKQLNRLQDPAFIENYENLLQSVQAGDEVGKLVGEKNYLDAISNEAVQQYKDYFESEGEEEFAKLEGIADADKVHFVRVFENYAMPLGENKGYTTIPKRKWDESLGLWQNFFYDVSDYTRLITPRATELLNQAHEADVSLPNREELASFNLYGDVQKIQGNQQKLSSSKDKESQESGKKQ